MFPIGFALLASGTLGSRPVPSSDPVGARLASSLVCSGASWTDEGKCIVFRRAFELKREPKQARLHLFANSRYVLWINGRYVDRGPARFEPSGPEYDTIDVGRFLRAGANAVSVLVTGPLSNGKLQWRPLCFAAELSMGRRMERTDATWRWSDRTRYVQTVADWANIEDIADARREDGDWTQAGYDDSGWPKAEPLPAPAEPIHVTTEVDGRKVSLSVAPFESLGNGRTWWGPLTARRIPLLLESPVEPRWQVQFPVRLKAGESASFQFSRLVLAYTRLTLDADAGTEVEFTYSPRSRYICKGGPQEFITSDTRSIFDGAIRIKSGSATLKSVEFAERRYPFYRVGKFHSSDGLLNRLWETCVRALEVTSEDAYIDCADRERVEWMDCDPPAFDVTRVAMAGISASGSFVHSDPRLLEEMLRRTAYSLQPDGWVKAHTCSDRYDIHAKMEDRACDWVQGVRRYYESTGRTTVIREIWPAIERQMDYFLDRRTSRGLVEAREWVVWGNPVGYQTCEGTALNAFICKSLRDAAFLGRLIGRREEAKRFAQAAQSLQESIDKLLWDEQAGTYFGGYYDADRAKQAVDYRPLEVPVEDGRIAPTRHAALFALDQGIVPEARRGRVLAYLMAHRPTDDCIMQYYYFFKQQYALDLPQEDLDVLNTLRREWKDMAESPYGATFEGLHASGSRAHVYGMFPAYFLSTYVLGVRRSGARNAKTILIEPRLGDLTEASGVVETECGPVSASWKVGKGGGAFDLEVPPSVKAILHLPPCRDLKVDGVDARPARRAGRWMEVQLEPGRHRGHWSS